MLAVLLSSQPGICLCLPLVLCTAQMLANAPRIAFPPLPVPAGAVAEGRLLLIVANKLDALAPAQRSSRGTRTWTAGRTRPGGRAG